jgi:hypothetical protein
MRGVLELTGLASALGLNAPLCKVHVCFFGLNVDLGVDLGTPISESPNLGAASAYSDAGPLRRTGDPARPISTIRFNSSIQEIWYLARPQPFP